MKKSTRYLSMLLVLVMMLGVIPAMSFASAAESTDITSAAIITRGDNGNVTGGLTDGKSGIAVDISWNTGTTAAPVLNPKCYVELDFGGEVRIDSINLVQYVDGRHYKWNAYVTNDNTKDISQWTDIGGKDNEDVSTAEGYTYTLETPAQGRYMRIYGTYDSANSGYHFCELTVKGKVLELNRNKLTISKFNATWENWSNATQLLVCLNDTELFDSNDEAYTVAAADVIAKIKNGTYKTQLIISGDENRTINVAPSSYYAALNMMRFEVCKAGFIPRKNNQYGVELNILNENDEIVYVSNRLSTTCVVDPIYVYDTGYTAPVYNLRYYGDGVEMKWNTPIMIPNGLPDRYGSDTAGYEWEVVVNGTAVYRDIPVLQNYDWGTSIMMALKLIEGGWFPKTGADNKYDVTLNVYSKSTPSGERVLDASFVMTEDYSFVRDAVTPAFIYSYDIEAENGLVYVDVEKTENSKDVTCKDNSGNDLTCTVPILKYTLKAVPENPLCEFDGWYLDGVKYEAITDTTFVFTAEEGDSLDIVAKFKYVEVTKDEGLKFEGYQYGEKGDIRFIGSADSLDYDNIDLLITVDEVPGKKFSVPGTKVFQTLNGMVNGVSTPVITTAGSGVTGNGIYVVDAEYLFGYAITGIPYGNYTFNITPVATKNGSNYIGETAVLQLTLGNLLAQDADCKITFTEQNNRNEGQSWKYNDGNTYLPAGQSEFNYYSQLVLNQETESYVIADLGAICALENVTVFTYNNNYEFEVYGSNDNEEWTKLGANVKGENYGQDGSYTVSFEGDYRYVKIVGISGSYGFFTFYEIQVFGWPTV